MPGLQVIPESGLEENRGSQVLDDDFSCYIPEDVYAYYFPKREHYARLAKLEIRKVLRDQMTKQKTLCSRARGN